MNGVSTRCYAWLAAGSVAVFLLIAVLAMFDATAGIDAAALRLGAIWRGWLAETATRLGYAGGLLPVAVAVSLLLLVRGRGWESPLPLLVLGTASAANQLLKLLLQRARPVPEAWPGLFPPSNDFAFPSGHAMNSMALYSLLFCWVVGSNMRGLPKAAVAAVLLIMPLAIGLSRVVLGVHWLSDVVGGWAAGLAVMSLVVLAYCASQPRMKAWLDHLRHSDLDP